MKSLFHMLFLDPHPTSVEVQLFRYTIVGSIAFLIDLAFYYVFTSRLGIHYLISGIFSFFFGLAVNYLLSKYWVFEEQKVESEAAAFGIVTGIAIGGLGLNELCLWVITSGFGVNYLISKVIASLLVYVYNFTARKRLVF